MRTVFRLLLVSMLLVPAGVIAQQGRGFDGTNDNLKSANDALAGLDAADQLSCGFWFYTTATGVTDMILTGASADGAGNMRFRISTAAAASSGFQFRLSRRWSTTTGNWDSPDTPDSVATHFAVTLDRSGAAPGNDPVMYINGSSVSVTEINTPAGTVTTGEDTIVLGEDVDATGDLSGVVQNVVCQVGTIWDAAAVNRVMRWGRPHGGTLFWYPFYTSALTDTTGSGQASLTASGSVMTTMPSTPAVRPGTGMMGMGVGW